MDTSLTPVLKLEGQANLQKTILLNNPLSIDLTPLPDKTTGGERDSALDYFIVRPSIGPFGV